MSAERQLDLAQLRANPPVVMTGAEAAVFLSVSTKTVQRLIATDQLRVARIGRCVRVTRQELERFLALQMVLS